jgi:AraC-like DNA-binding protein
MLKRKYLFNNELEHTDLYMYQCGNEDCDPKHSCGPAIRDHFLIHYITKGKGIFQVDGKTYKLKDGDGFLICPNAVTYYEADEEDPWSYFWVGFHGVKAEVYLKYANLTVENPVFEYIKDDFLKDCIEEMIRSQTLKNGREIKQLGLLWLFISRLNEVSQLENLSNKEKDGKKLYVNKAIEYVNMNYSRKITVMSLSNYLGLDRSYLYSLFKEYLNISPQEFLIDVRVAKACEFMSNANLSIGDIARSVGYNDQLLFSKMFKKIKGVSPNKYRKENVL